MDEVAGSHKPEPDQKWSRLAIAFLIFTIPAWLGLGLLWGIIHANSATYDEVTYVRLACEWWRTGDFAEISRMGSPVTFWRWQAAPALVWMQWAEKARWIDHPLDFISQSLPVFRLSALSFWLAGLWGTQFWAFRFYDRWAALFAGLIYALGPNLLAHGALFTMECPLWACWLWACMAFWAYLNSGKRVYFITTAILAGITFSMKFTAVLLPPILLAAGLLSFALENRPLQLGLIHKKNIARLTGHCILFITVMLLANLAITGFAVVPLSQQRGAHPFLDQHFSPAWAARFATILEMPLPVDWVGFLNQLKHQRNGGPSYLFGEISESGWKWYYLVTIAVKVPLAILVAIILRCFLIHDFKNRNTWFLPVSSLLFLAVACGMSKRNYGFRYLLPLAPVMIVWLAGLVQNMRGRVVAVLLTVILSVNIARVHPWELSYFNEFVGSPEAGRKILADSNLDWGQGLLLLQKMQSVRPELASTTLFYFGDLEPARYGIAWKSYEIDASDRFEHLPGSWHEIRTKYVAVSTSLSDGPWGPTAFFKILREIQPIAVTSDGSIRVYKTSEIQAVIEKK